MLVPTKWQVNQAVRESELPAPSRLIMFVLSDVAEAQTGAVPAKRTPSVRQLVAETGLKESAVKKHLALLESSGWLERSRPSAAEAARHVPSRYRLEIGNPSPGGHLTTPEDPIRESPDDPRKQPRGSQGDPRNEDRESPDDPRIPVSGVTRRPPMPIDEVENLDDLKAAADAAAPQSPQPITEDTPKTLRKPRKPREPKEPAPPKHEAADALAARFWEIHRAATAQPFLAIRGVIRTAIANGIERDELAQALDRLAREHRAISGGTITTAIGQNRNTQRGTPRRQSNDAGLAAAMQRAMAAEAAQTNPPPRKELTA